MEFTDRRTLGLVPSSHRGGVVLPANRTGNLYAFEPRAVQCDGLPPVDRAAFTVTALGTGICITAMAPAKHHAAFSCARTATGIGRWAFTVMAAARR